MCRRGVPIFPVANAGSTATIEWLPSEGERTSRTEEQLAFQAVLLDQLQDAIIAVDGEERITYLNPAAAKQYGVSPADALGQQLSDVYQYLWLSPEAEAQAYATLADRGHWRGENYHVTRNGHTLHVESTVNLLKGKEGEPAGMVADIRNINTHKQSAEERARAVQELVTEQTQRAQMTAWLADAVHREHERVATILHNHVQQILYGIQMRTQLIALNLPVQSEDVIQARLAELKQLAEEAIHAARGLAHELNPPILETNDVWAILQWLADHMRELHKLDITLTVQGRPKIRDKQRRILFFYTVSELLFNVVKHAGVLTCEVTVTEEDELMQVSIRDVGRGFELSRLSQNSDEHGSGLSNAQGRLQLLHGQMHIRSAPGQGTAVTVLLPQ